MGIELLLDMAATGHGERTAVGGRGTGPSYEALRSRARRGARAIRDTGAEVVLYLGSRGGDFPIVLYASAYAGVPLVPLNYRLGATQLDAILDEQPSALMIADSDYHHLVAGKVTTLLPSESWTDGLEEIDPVEPDDDSVALVLYTSGTSSAPKAALLRHRHLLSYVFATVEFGGADADEAALVSVPPYHVAGVAAVLTNVYAGRRLVYLDRFDPDRWLEIAAAERITNAMLVPTMLARVVERIDAGGGATAPPIATLSYGGSKAPLTVVERALELFPETNFVNAYGLTETASTIAMLGPEHHREAVSSDDPDIRARLGSVGRPLDGVECQIRNRDGQVLGPGESGELWVRGAQVSGEYGAGPRNDDDGGWFSTKDSARIDVHGFIHVEGRADDTIIRGGENIAPAEIEDVLMRYPNVSSCAVVGLSDVDWGQRIEAVVVPRGDAVIDTAEMREWMRSRLRTSKTPDHVHIWDELPHTDTGKVIRRHVRERLESAARS